MRVLGNLNLALHKLLSEDDSVFVLGEDILDPYGGAFKATKGLSTEFPERVITTPISEQGILAVANGLSLCGNKPICEVMFGDFLFLAFDQLVNFSAKTPTMYGEQVPHPLIVRAPMGGNRGYGATHSQTVFKHLIGVPNLEIFELSQFHDCYELFLKILKGGLPTLFVESKNLYAKDFHEKGHTEIDDMFVAKNIGGVNEFTLIHLQEDDESSDVLLICGGGMVPHCLEAAKSLFVEEELSTKIVVPARLYPFNFSSIENLVSKSSKIAIIEESTSGGTWGSEVATCLYSKFWNEISNPIEIISSRDSTIPAARHLENKVLVQPSDIVKRISQGND